MGLDEETLTAITTINGLVQSNRAAKATQGAQAGVGQAPGQALANLGQFESVFGAPNIGQSQFFGFGPGGTDALQKAIFEQQRALLAPQFAQARERVMQDMARRGLSSSLQAEQLGELQRAEDLALQQAAAQATQQAFGLQASEQERRTAFDREQALDPFRIQQARAGQLGVLGGQSLSGALGQGQLGLGGLGMQQDIMAGVGTGVGGLLQSQQNAAFQQNLLDRLGGETTPRPTTTPTASTLSLPEALNKFSGVAGLVGGALTGNIPQAIAGGTRLFQQGNQSEGADGTTGSTTGSTTGFTGGGSLDPGLR
jgi:hypothetical protein